MLYVEKRKYGYDIIRMQPKKTWQHDTVVSTIYIMHFADLDSSMDILAAKRKLL